MVYSAFGLTIESELPLPELSRIFGNNERIDIDVIIESSLKDTIQLEPYDFVVEGSIVTVYMPDAAVFRIENGDKIIISPNEGADEDLIRLYVLGTCIGALLLQRSIYPLHGSAIAIDGKAYAFVGHSGSGKSTLASAFISRGYPLLSDDVIAVSRSAPDKVPLVIPAYPQQKLWQQSLDAFGVNKEELRAIYGRENKFCIPVESDFCSTPLPLGGVFELTKTDTAQVGIHPLNKLERLDILFQHTYRQFLVQKLGLTLWHFTHSASLAAELPIYQLQRPTSSFTAPQLVELILNTISAEA
jgi:energy-coupling factor transporter ATP-binding protein EcfA2